MAQILTPGFLKWDGTKYVLDPTVEGSTGPTITNSGTGVLPNITSDESGVPASVIAFIGTANMSLTGVKDGVESREIKVFNTNNAAVLTIKHLDNSSSVINQIICPGGVDFTLSYQEGVSLIYSNVESKWRVVDKNISAGGSPGGADTQLQFNNNGVFGGITNWNSSGQNRVHVESRVMQQGPALEFNGHVITRLFASWLDDGFKVGDLFSIRGDWFDNFNVPQTPLNIVNTTITNVTDTQLTMAAIISPIGYALAGDTWATGGGVFTGGDPAGTLPDSGIIRMPPLEDQYTDQEVMTTRDNAGNTVPIISINQYSDLMIGGTYNESNRAAGVTNRRPSSIAMWGAFKLDYTDERVWRDDKGAFYEYNREFRAQITTTNATPTLLISKTSFSSTAPFIELHISANKFSPGGENAAWRFFGSKASTTNDWRTFNYHVNTAGAGSWTAVVTGDATITVTGQAGTNIQWRVYGRFIV